jgi:lipopolysaccharide heptosyltransferase II
VIQALPVLRLIKRQMPHSEVYWWVEAGLAGLLEGDPDLSGVIRFNRRNWGAPKNLRKLWRDIQWMRGQRFDWVIDLQSLARSGFIAWLANGKITIGLDEHREGARCLFDVAVPRGGYHRHAVDWYLSTLPRLGVRSGEFTWIPPRHEAARAIREKWPVDGAVWVLLQPGARWENKRWPANYYASVARQLASRNPGLRFAILGSAEDRTLAEKIAELAPGVCMDLTGALKLPEMIEWVRSAVLMISNDTGPMHVAAALGTPLVAIFGPTEPARTGPHGALNSAVRAHLECSPCMKDRCSRKSSPLECLTSVTPDRVARLAQQRLNQRSAGTTR